MKKFMISQKKMKKNEKSEKSNKPKEKDKLVVKGKTTRKQLQKKVTRV